MNQPSTIEDIVDLLLPLDPYRIVLFGSYAKERENPESDLDLLIILDSEAISQTYEDRMSRKNRGKKLYPRDQSGDPF